MMGSAHCIRAHPTTVRDAAPADLPAPLPNPHDDSPLPARLLRKGEQVIVGSPFHAFSHSLHNRLRFAGVSSVLLDGDTDPVERGRLAEHFKARQFSVAVAGLAAMCEGLDFDNCAHII